MSELFWLLVLFQSNKEPPDGRDHFPCPRILSQTCCGWVDTPVDLCLSLSPALDNPPFHENFPAH
eukprot:3345507-Ditylum_brightwellii.AAC.1